MWIAVAGLATVAVIGGVFLRPKPKTAPDPAPQVEKPAAAASPAPAQGAAQEPVSVPAAQTPALAEPPSKVPAKTGPQVGTVRFNGDFSVRVRVDGKDMGEFTSGKALPLPEGLHTLDLSQPKVFFKDSHRINLGAGRTHVIDLPAVVNVTVETFPGSGAVLIDGQPAGIESEGGQSVHVASGDHTFSILGRSMRHSASVNRDGQLVKFGPIAVQ
jgi:hypothetical protein